MKQYICLLVATKTQTHIGGGGDASSGQRFPAVTAESSLGQQQHPPHDQMAVKQEVVAEHTNVPMNSTTAEYPGAMQLSNIEPLQGGFERLQGSSGGGGDGLAKPVSPETINVETKPQHILVATCSGTMDTHPVFIRSRQTDSSQHLFLARHPQQVVSTTALSSFGQMSGKWPAMVVMSNNNPGQVVTKVIITKNPLTSQPQAVPALGNTISPSGFAIGDSGNAAVLQQQVTPTKAITVSHCGVLSPQRIMTAPSTPTKQILPSNKVPISPMKTPSKITMIPMSMTKSPQRLGGQVVAMVARTVGSNVNRTPSMSTNTQASTITMSPSKVIIKGQQVTVVSFLPIHVCIMNIVKFMTMLIPLRFVHFSVVFASKSKVVFTAGICQNYCLIIMFLKNMFVDFWA